MSQLSRKFANRKSVLRNLATSMVLYEQIKTTQAKAKEIKPIVERLVNLAKKNDLSARRVMLGYLFDENATKKVFEVLAPRYKDIKSGFIKTYKVGHRLGDSAPMMILKFDKGQPSQEMSVAEVTKDENKEGKNAKENNPKAGDKVKDTPKKVDKTGGKTSSSKKTK